MLALGLVLNTLGIGLVCWALFALAVHALPFFVALNIGMAALQSGVGVIGALIGGMAGGALTIVLAQNAVAALHSRVLRFGIAAAFAVPATVAGYHAAFALSKLGVSSAVWQDVLACLGAAGVGGTAWSRLISFPQRPSGKAGCSNRLADVRGSCVLRAPHIVSVSEQIGRSVIERGLPALERERGTPNLLMRRGVIEMPARPVQAAWQRDLNRFLRDNTVLCGHSFLILRWFVSTPCSGRTRYATSLPGIAVQHANTVASLMARSGRRPASPRSSEPQRR